MAALNLGLSTWSAMGKQRDIRPYVVHQALQELGWDASAQAIAHKVKLLEIGLPAEDEFSVLLGWLGQCKVVHKLDQSVPPATDLYRIPTCSQSLITEEGACPSLSK